MGQTQISKLFSYQFPVHHGMCYSVGMKEQWMLKLKEDRAILAAFLTGSRAHGEADSLSDYDIVLIVKGNCQSLNEWPESWKEAFGRLVVVVHEQVEILDETLMTRLCLFEGGVKADFTFADQELIRKLKSRTLPEEWERGVQILFDKTGVLGELVSPVKRREEDIPSREEDFVRLANEFWFEAYHVAVYLTRGDLWQAKSRFHGILDQMLLPMIELHAAATQGSRLKVRPSGKKMHEWASESHLQRIPALYCPFTAQESWRGLRKLMDLFRDIAKESASKLNFAYPESVDREVSGWIERLRKGNLTND